MCLAKCLKFPKFEAGCAYELYAYKKRRVVGISFLSGDWKMKLITLGTKYMSNLGKFTVKESTKDNDGRLWSVSEIQSVLSKPINHSFLTQQSDSGRDAKQQRDLQLVL